MNVANGDFQLAGAIPPEATPQALAPLAARIWGRLAAYPHFCLLTGRAPTSDRAAALTLSRLIAGFEPEGSLIRHDPALKVSFTEVAPKPGHDGTEDGKAMTTYSRTNQPMGFHTDTSYAEQPHEVVAFQMVRADAEGGETIMVAVEDIVAALPGPVLETLGAPVFPFGMRKFPILTRAGGRPRIRYYRRQIETAINAGASLDAPALAAMDALDAVLDDPAYHHRFRIEAGEILFMHNRCTLHGRTGFPPGSRRLMFRYRTRAPQLG